MPKRPSRFSFRTLATAGATAALACLVLLVASARAAPEAAAPTAASETTATGEDAGPRADATIAAGGGVGAERQPADDGPPADRRQANATTDETAPTTAGQAAAEGEATGAQAVPRTTSEAAAQGSDEGADAPETAGANDAGRDTTTPGTTGRQASASDTTGPLDAVDEYTVAGDPTHVDNPYNARASWARLPGDRTFGQTTAVHPNPGTTDMWIIERCGGDTCVDRDDIHPVVRLNQEGNPVEAIGAGEFVQPQGLDVGPYGNVWVTDVGNDGARGHTVHKLGPEGQPLLILGTPGVAGRGKHVFDRPADVLVAPGGSIFVADGLSPEGNNRIVKYDAEGNYLLEWGGTGAEDGELRAPSGLAMDSRGRLFVADRGNDRIQIFDQQGNHLETWTQFGRPSGLFIDHEDILYVSDAESGEYSGNRGWARGIRVGSALDGWVDSFIPAPTDNPDLREGPSGVAAVAADGSRNVYGAEAGQGGVVYYDWGL